MVPQQLSAHEWMKDKSHPLSKGFYYGIYCSGNYNFYLFLVVVIGGDSHDIVWSANNEHPLLGNTSVQLMRDKRLSTLRLRRHYSVVSVQQSQ